MPFPSEETTPPVTKMYLAIVILHRLVSRRANSSRTFQILRGIHAQRFVFRLHYPDGEAVFQRAQLFQPLGLFQRPDRQVGIPQQKIAPVDVKPDVLVNARPSRAVARKRNGRAGKINARFRTGP